MAQLMCPPPSQKLVFVFQIQGSKTIFQFSSNKISSNKLTLSLKMTKKNKKTKKKKKTYCRLLEKRRKKRFIARTELEAQKDLHFIPNC